VDLVVGLLVGLVVGLVGGLVGGLAWGLALGLAFIMGYIFILFGLYSYPYYLLKYQLFKPSLIQNPYINNSYNYFPIFGIKKALSDECFSNSIEGIEKSKNFIDFLFKFRPYQRDLAFYLLNVINASKFYHNPLKNSIEIPKDYKKNQPTQSFIDNLKDYKNELISYNTQNNLQFKEESLETIITILKRLKEDMIRETRGWREYYLKAIDKNIEVADSELKNLKFKRDDIEPIQANIYRIGDVLSPKDKTSIFKGRVDIKNTLSRIIYTSTTMPLLFIQGQRRVGKTSLINYLEVLLGSGFKLIKIDMQQARNKKFNNLLKNLNTQINEKLGVDERIELNQDINKNWVAFEEYLIRNTTELNYKLIISFDEYENFHKNIASQYPEILGYMRAFLQNQEQVVFLFVGLKDIAELTKPNWDEYFPQIQKLKVDYLDYEESKELIVKPIKEFSLIYPDSIVEEIIKLTQGHPQLLQTICWIIVDIANAKETKNITQDIFDKAINKIFDVNDRPMSNFYREYCDDIQREIIEEILANKPIIQDTKEQRRALLRLIDYGFVTDTYKIRVPLFEKWLIEKREFIEIY
jgi:Holliday junction resolvasome RuvABC ATP-dependent DNA helicase subunit